MTPEQEAFVKRIPEMRRTIEVANKHQPPLMSSELNLLTALSVIEAQAQEIERYKALMEQAHTTLVEQDRGFRNRLRDLEKVQCHCTHCDARWISKDGERG